MLQCEAFGVLFYVKTKFLVDFDIFISVPLKTHFNGYMKDKIYCFIKWAMENVLLKLNYLE